MMSMAEIILFIQQGMIRKIILEVCFYNHNEVDEYKEFCPKGMRQIKKFAALFETRNTSSIPKFRTPCAASLFARTIVDHRLPEVPL